MELGWCTEKGIPHSTFLEWHPDDRSKVVAYLLEEAERCDMCGTSSWEWKENRFAYEPVETFCHGCYQKSVYSETEQDPLPGTTVSLVPVTEYRKAERAVAAEKQRAMEKRDREELERVRDGAGADS